MASESHNDSDDHHQQIDCSRPAATRGLHAAALPLGAHEEPGATDRYDVA
eukprot:CAMPEP_0205877796 /NCGR_PEP_ID=MMETSP1083-20121108/14511_1 /ASSEMBLY_ACC=CAM_ASM_000430 /TAXON_ID=97485 /ORGANISM="Prymnesium parvum, Strain Texoma1" /LENGTH=49 /DNA_ID=CAMNT_0053240625 /DNA_START=732 /DNA_END=881 /DNA_ORIENTATION=+